MNVRGDKSALHLVWFILKDSFLGAAGEEDLAGHVHREHDIRRSFDQSFEICFARRKLLLHAFAVRDVAHDHAETVAPLSWSGGGRQFDGKFVPILMQCGRFDDFVEVGACAGDLKISEFLFVIRSESLRKDQIDD
jgi:hypothetical protein